MSRRLEGSGCVILHGFDPDSTRKELLTELSKYGDISKLYIPFDKEFAKIYYSSAKEAKTAITEISRNKSTWHLEFFDKMDYYDELDNLVENSNYVDVHGRNLDVLESDNGDIFIPLKDIRQTGFAIFRRDNFDPSLVNKEQIVKEFEKHMLAEARKYLLSNKVMAIDEEQILRTIKKCEDMLLGNNNAKTVKEPRRCVSKAGENLTITSRVDNSQTNKCSPPVKPENHKFNDFASLSNSNTPKKPQHLPSNFAPTNQRAAVEQYQKQNHRAKPKSFSPQNFNDSSNMRMPKGFDDNKDNTAISSNEKSSFVENNDFNSNHLKTSKGFSDKVNSSNSSFSDSAKTPRYVVTDYIVQEELPLHESVQLRIEHMEKEKIFWAVKVANSDIIDDLFLKINQQVKDMPVVKNPQIGTLGIAEFEGAWSRVLVQKMTPFVVHFIDFGNVSHVDCIRTAPADVINIPAQAMRIKQCDNDLSQLTCETVLTLTAKKKYDDNTYVVSSKSQRVHTPSSRDRNEFSSATCKQFDNKFSEKEKFVNETEDKKEKQVYFKIPQPISRLPAGTKVMVLDCDQDELILRSKDCNDKFVEVTQYIKKLDKSELILPSVKKGQMVLCGKEGCNGLFRAEVTDIESPVATVKYIDLTGDESLSIKSLRNVDEFLSEYPSTLIKSSEIKNFSKYVKNSECNKYIDNLILSKTKLTVVTDNGFDLALNDETLLSKHLNDLLNDSVVKADPPKVASVKKEAPKEEKPVAEKTVEEKCSTPKPADKNVSASTPINFDDMDYVKLKIGKDEYLSYSFESMDQLTLLSLGPNEMEWLSHLSTLEVTDTEHYYPECTEMCLARYQEDSNPDEESWSRGVVCDIENGEYSVLFVDFGNTRVLTPKDLRKFPAKLKEIPILGAICGLVGIPNDKKIFEKLKPLLDDGQVITVDVKSHDDEGKYLIEIPDLYKKLKSDGLF